MGARKRAKPEHAAYMREYGKRWYAENKERLKPIRAAWHAENYATKRKPKMVQNEANRRARIRSAAGTHTLDQVLELCRKQKGKCACCRVSLGDRYHRDHITPLASGGSNDISNIQILCPGCNRSKNARDPIKFMQENGYLL